MSKKGTTADLLKALLEQISGKVNPDQDLIPEYGIVGSGHLWCFDPSDRSFKKINRGIKAYIIIENYDKMGRALIYTANGDLVCIEPDELILTGFD